MDHLARQRAVAVAVAVAGLAAVFALVGGSATARAAARLGGFSVRPAHFDPAVPATRAYFIHSVGAGRSFTDEVVVSNQSPHVVRLYVDPVDGLTGVTSGTVYANRRDRRRWASRWVRAGLRQITLAPRQARSVSFRVDVPHHARPGDHVAGLAFENSQPAHSPGRFAVTVISRQVVGILVRVPGRARRRIALRKVVLGTLPGSRITAAFVTLADVGGKLCKPRLALTIGRSRRVRRQLDTVLPGQQIPYPFPWPYPVSPEARSIRVRATGCGRPALLIRTVRTIRPSAGPGGHPSLAAASSGGTPWWLVALAAVGGLGIGVMVRRRRESDD